MSEYKGFDIDMISDALSYKADIDLDNTEPSAAFKAESVSWVSPKIIVVRGLPPVQEPDTIYFVVES